MQPVLQAHFDQEGAGAVRPVLSVQSAGQHGHLYVFQGVEGGQQIEGLEDEADVFGAVAVQIDMGSEQRVLKEDLAAGGRVETANQLQEGGFAAAAGAADGHVFTGMDGEIDAAQGLDASLVVAFLQIADF